MNTDSIRSTSHSNQMRYADCCGRAGKEHVEGASNTAKPPELTDAFEKTEGTEVTADGRVRFILSFDDARAAQSASKSFSGQKSFRVGENYPLVNGFSVEVKPDGINGLLKSLPVGAKVAMDRQVAFGSNFTADPALKAGVGRDGEKPSDITNAVIGIDKVWAQGYTGKGQTIAIIDSGIYPHEDLKDKIVAWVDVQSGQGKPFDDFGHGTHVAGVAAGSGVKSAGAHKGVAPDANLVGVRISNVSEAIKGIQWVIENKEKYDIGVINMSLGDFACRSYKDDPWSQAAQKAMEAGLVVCVAAGNDGPSTQNISTPGIHPDVITVGALDDKRTLYRSDDQVAEFSSRGPTVVDGIHKPDLLAPGVSIYGPLSPGSQMDTPDFPHDKGGYFAISGTSMATPMVAGLAAVLLQANPSLSQADVKSIMVKSCDDYLGDEQNAQGAGVINAEKALKLALEWNTKAGEEEAVKAQPTGSGKKGSKKSAAASKSVSQTPAALHTGTEGFLMA